MLEKGADSSIARPCTNTKCHVCKKGLCTDPQQYRLFDPECSEYQDRYSSGKLKVIWRKK